MGYRNHFFEIILRLPGVIDCAGPQALRRDSCAGPQESVRDSYAGPLESVRDSYKGPQDLVRDSTAGSQVPQRDSCTGPQVLIRDYSAGSQEPRRHSCVTPVKDFENSRCESRTTARQPALLIFQEKFPHPSSSVVNFSSDYGTYISMTIKNHYRIRLYMLMSIRIPLKTRQV